MSKRIDTIKKAMIELLDKNEKERSLPVISVSQVSIWATNKGLSHTLKEISIALTELIKEGELEVHAPTSQYVAFRRPKS